MKIKYTRGNEVKVTDVKFREALVALGWETETDKKPETEPEAEVIPNKKKGKK